MQELYNKLKQRTLYPQMKTAASDAADRTLLGAGNVGDPIYDDAAILQNDHRIRAPISPHRPQTNSQLIGGRSLFNQPHTREDTSGIGSGRIGGITRPSFSRTATSGAGIVGGIIRKFNEPPDAFTFPMKLSVSFSSAAQSTSTAASHAFT